MKPVHKLLCAARPALWIPLIVTALGAAGGCGTLVAPLDEIPALLAVVLENPEANCAAAPADTNGLAPIADPESLNGCWSTCLDWGPGELGGSLITAQALQIDAATGQVERFIYQNVPPFFRYVDVQRGTLAISADGAVTFTVTQLLTTAKTGSLADISGNYEHLPSYDVQWGMDGTALVANFDEPDDPRTVGGFLDRVALRHQRVDCP